MKIAPNVQCQGSMRVYQETPVRDVYWLIKPLLGNIDICDARRRNKE